MHEFSLMNDLMRKIEDLAKQNNASKVTKVKVTLGALSHISEDHFREHFEHGIQGTIAGEASLDVTKMSDISHPRAEEIILESIDVE